MGMYAGIVPWVPGPLRWAGGTLRGYWRAILYDLDPRSVELLTTALSLWFCIAQGTSESRVRPEPWWAWAIWCGCAAVLKGVGVLSSLHLAPPWWSIWARRFGAGMGATFWSVLATVLYFLAGGGITWGGFLILAVAQWLVLFRLTRRGA